MTFIIAEIGVNHNGSLALAKKLCKMSKLAGSNAIKIQSYISDLIVTKNLNLAPYQNKNIYSKKKNKKIKMVDMIKKYELSFEDQEKIFKYCKKIRIEFISSPFDLKSAEFLIKKLKLKKIKVASGEINNYPLLNFLSKNKIEIILSTGMSNLQEIRNACKILKSKKKIKKITLLHCNTDYPTEHKDVNLLAMNLLKKKFKMSVGLSDHSTDNRSSLYAVSLGATIIERHVTLNRKMNGPDHRASLEYNHLKSLIDEINILKKIHGKEKKFLTQSEKKNIRFARKVIVANKDILKGELFNEDNLTTKRSNKGIDPMKWNKIVKKVRAKKNFFMDQEIQL